ncbi:hypothetical protein C7120_06175 [Prevotella sp. oral taxon 376]|nr:hypothetical protein C7120_06175 [Prevotella sp. oral taxon 376]
MRAAPAISDTSTRLSRAAGKPPCPDFPFQKASYIVARYLVLSAAIFVSGWLMSFLIKKQTVCGKESSDFIFFTYLCGKI